MSILSELRSYRSGRAEILAHGWEAKEDVLDLSGVPESYDDKNQHQERDEEDQWSI